MARIQYQPAAQRRGFRPQKLSTAGIDRMREESNRLIRGMEQRRRDQKEERDRQLQAMKENQAYEAQIERENFKIRQQNLQNEAGQKIANIQGEIKQSQIDSKAFQDTLSTLADFSKTIAKTAAERTAQMVKDQTAIGLSADIQNIDAQTIEDYTNAKSVQAQGAVRLDTEIGIEGVLSNEDPYETMQGYVSNHGFSGIAARANDNKVAVQAYNITLGKRLQDVETTYTAANGQTFTGAEARRDPYLMSELQAKTRKDVSAYMGFTDPMYLAKAIGEIDKSDAVLRGQARSEGMKDLVAVTRQQAEDIISEGTAESVALAFARIKQVDGVAAAHDFVRKYVADPDFPLEAIENSNLRGNGKLYSEEWGPTQGYRNAIQQREEQFVKNLEFEKRQQKALYEQSIEQRLPELYTRYSQDPVATGAEMRNEANQKGLSYPTVLKEIESAALKRNKEETALLLETMASYNILDIDFVNSIEDRQLQTEGKRLYEEQQVRKYGENYPALLAGIDDYAKKLGKFSSQVPGATSTKVEQIKIAMKKWVEKDLKATQNSNVTTKTLETLVQNAHLGSPDNPFSYKDTDGGRVFVNIGTVNEEEVKEQAQYTSYILDLASKKTLGELADMPYLLASERQIEQVSAAASEGRGFKYPHNIEVTAERYGVKPSELFNAQVTAANKVSGKNTPLLTPNPIVTLLDNVSARQRKLATSGNPDQINRFSSEVTGNMPMRSSMMQSTGVKGLADLVSSGEGSPTAMFPGEDYPEMTDMTIREVVNLQKEKLRDGRESAAVGAYQFLYPERAAQLAGLSIDDKFTPENQLKMFMGTLLNKPGRENVSAFLQGTGDNIEAAIDELAQEFASIEYRNGRSYYDDGVNKASIGRDQVRAALLSAREELTTQ